MKINKIDNAFNKTIELNIKKSYWDNKEEEKCKKFLQYQPIRIGNKLDIFA